jgi:hypothetical protein
VYKFTIKYYFEKHRTGGTNTEATREAVVFARTKTEAKSKICAVDGEFIDIASVRFEEVEVY